MLVRAQQYLHAHPPNCDLGVTYLQTAAESNPKARIQMAALYASGVCVRQDRAEAYKWFSRAQDLDPHNSWLERNRVRLWAEMTPDERARAH
jgi:TPR repeat protein